MPRAPSRADVALAAALGMVTVAELFAPYAFEHSSLPGPTGLHVVVAALAGAGLAWRRVHPLLVALCVAGLLAFQPLLVARPNVYGEAVVLLVALYGVTAHAPPSRARAVTVAATLVLAGLFGLSDDQDPVGGAVTSLVVTVGTFLVGVLARRQRDPTDAMRVERDDADVRARTILDHEPEAARRALTDIERVAGECLAEMRRLIGILRDAEPSAGPLTPHPRLTELTSLVDRA